MSNPRIEVDVVANVAGIASGVTAATTQLDKLGKAAQATAPKFEQLSKSTSRYNGIGIDFARVIQDAPFGIIGVGNNIQQLAQSFSSLGNAGDSTKSKIKLAFQQIFTSGNLLVLAVSAITTVLTLYERGAFKSTDATEDLNKKLDDYRENLQGIAKANLEGIKNAQSEIANFKLLQAQAENTNNSLQKRIEAVEQLKKQYPEYLKNLTNEQILTSNVGTAYENLTASIIATAKAKAFQSQIGENALNQATLAAQVEDNLVKIKELQIEKSNVLAASEKQSARDKQDFLTRASAIQSNINALDEQNKLNKKETTKLDAENLKLAGQINEKVSQGADFVKETGKAIDENKNKFKEYSDGWDKYNEKVKFADELTLLLAESSNKLGKEVDAILEKSLKEIQLTFAPVSKGLDLSNLEKGIIIQPEIADIDKSRKTNFILGLKQFNQEASDILTNGFINGLGDIGFAIGEALATGGDVVQAAGKALLGGIATIAEALGQEAIAIGVGMIAIKMAFKNPATAIAAGVALIALAGYIRAKIGGGGGGGGGVTSSVGGGGGGSSVGSSGVGGGTSFAGGGQGGLFQQNKDLNGELVVRGQDLVYVFAQANNKINKG